MARYIPPPREDFIDPRTRKIAVSWFRYLMKEVGNVDDVQLQAAMNAVYGVAAAAQAEQMADEAYLLANLPVQQQDFSQEIEATRLAASYIDTGELDKRIDDLHKQFIAVKIPAISDHGNLTGLADDDHTQYLLANGTRALTADWDAGSFEIRAQTFESDVTTGTAPLVIASTTKVANLNADLLDDQSGAYYLDSTNFTGANWTDLTDGGGTTLHTHASGGVTDFTEAAQDAAGAMAANSTRVTLTYVDATPSLTADLVANTITAGYLSASATDVLFGRSTVGAGAGEEIACTSFARSILDDANEATFKATVNLEIGTDVQAFDAQLASLAALSYTGNSLKVVRVNVGETDFELATIAGTGDVTAASNLTDNAIVRGDGGTKGVQTSGVIIDDTNNVTGMASLTLTNTGLHLLDTNASHDLIIAPGSDLTADHTLTITTGDADRTLTIDASTTLNGGTHSGTNTGDQTSVTGNAGTVTVANEATDTSCFILFATAASGSLEPKTNANLTLNSNTGVVTFASSVLTTTDINGGTIDNAAIGGATPAAGAFTTISASGQITSTVTTGTAPLVIASTTKVANLNADLLDDQSGAYYLDSANFTGVNWTDLTDTGATTLHKHDHGGMDGLSDNDHPQYLLVADIDDTPVNGELAQPISSNWAFDHVAAADPHTGYRLESADHNHQSTGAQAGQLDHGLALTGLTDDDHGQYWNAARGAARVSLRI